MAINAHIVIFGGIILVQSMFLNQGSVLIREVHIRVQEKYNAELSCSLIKCIAKRNTWLAQGHSLLLHWELNKKKSNT